MRNLITVLGALFLLSLFACAEKRPVKELEPNRFRIKKALISDGLYYFKETITKSDLEASTATVGNLGSSRIVRLKFSENYLTIYNVDKKSTDFMKKSSDTPFSSERVLSRFPVSKHIDVRREKDENGDKTNKMVETEEDRSWDKREYAIVDFTDEELLDRGNYYEGYGIYQDGEFLSLESAGEISELVVLKDIINITALKRASLGKGENSTLVNVRYSFMPVEKSDYKGKEVSAGILDKVGFFTQDQMVVDNNYVTKDRPLLVRRDPRKKVVYYLSKNWTSGNGAKYKHLAYQAVKEWNKVFKKQLGIDNFIELKESDGTQRLGDIRYSMLEWIEEPFDSVPLGFGPSINNPFSGEIINADTMIYGGAILRHVWYLRDSKKHTTQKAMSEEKRPVEKELVKEEKVKAVVESSIKKDEDKKGLVKHLEKIDLRSLAQRYSDRETQQKYLSFNAKFNSKEENSLAELMNAISSNRLVGKNIAQLVRNKSSEHKHLNHADHADHADEGRDCSGLYDRDKMAMALDDAAELGMSDEEFIESFMLFAITHEMGHNLGLRHNFRASVDKKNFYPDLDEKGELKFRQASVMDYSADVAHLLDRPGKYDIAAIDLLYNDSSKDALQNRLTKFDYEFCTDQHVDIDPLCNRFDKGSTPYEVAKDIADSYHDEYVLRNLESPYGKRYYTQYFDAMYYYHLRNNYFLPLRSFIDYKEKNNLQGESWDKAVDLSVNFFLSALYNSYPSAHEMNRDEEVKVIGTGMDRMLAVDFLTMESISEEIGEGYYDASSGISYFDYMQKKKGKDDTLVRDYRMAISGIFRPYDMYQGESKDENSMMFMSKGLRAYAAAKLINIFDSSTYHLAIPFNFSFKVVEDPYLIDRISNAENNYLEMSADLSEKFEPILEERDLKSSTEVMAFRDNYIVELEKRNIKAQETEIIKLLNSYVENLKQLENMNANAVSKEDEKRRELLNQTLSSLETIRMMIANMEWPYDPPVTTEEYAQLIERAKASKRFSEEELKAREEGLRILTECRKNKAILDEELERHGINKKTKYYQDLSSSRLIIASGSEKDNSGRFSQALLEKVKNFEDLTYSKEIPEEVKQQIRLLVNDELLFIYQLHDIYRAMMPGLAP